VRVMVPWPWRRSPKISIIADRENIFLFIIVIVLVHDQSYDRPGGWEVAIMRQ
jgi:hypothetical protein